MSEAIKLQRREFTCDVPGPHLLITGGVHGDEFEPVAAIRRLIRRLEAMSTMPKFLRGRLTLVPVVNEAAFLSGARRAEDGLDLARVCPGDPNGSVTERTGHALSELIRAADHYIDLHSGGTAFSVLPLAGYMLHADEAIRDCQREMAKSFNLPIVWGTSPDLDGRSLSVARDAGVPAIYAEYHGSGLCDPAGVDAYVAGCFSVMQMLEMIDGVPQTDCLVEHVIEDPRPASGVMQLCNPSPMTGLYEPTVELGARIDAGDLIGTVHDPLGNESMPIPARKTGILLVQRTFSRVRKGESIGVVLETTRAPAETS